MQSYKLCSKRKIIQNFKSNKNYMKNIQVFEIVYKIKK